MINYFTLEPWCSNIYANDHRSYVEQEQPNTLFNLWDKVRYGASFRENNIIVSIDGNKFTQQDFNIIQQLPEIIADSGATQFESLFRCLYDNVDEYTANVGDAIIVIAQYQYEYGFVVDKEICVAAMLNKLLKL